MPKGFMYLAVVMDWYSRYVISYKFSNTLDTRFCIEALEASLAKNKPIIFYTDQGSQFSSMAWQKYLTAYGITISMSGKGRAIDNIMIERFFRSLKYESLYINPALDVIELKKLVSEYIEYYNNERIHQGLNNRVPRSLYYESKN